MQLNEFKYHAETGKEYLIYFLKFWQVHDHQGDYIVKYQIRAAEHDFVWYGRISQERFMIDLKLDKENLRTMAPEELANQVQNHLRQLFVYVMKKGLDKGFEEPNIEFVFYREPLFTKRVWQD